MADDPTPTPESAPADPEPTPPTPTPAEPSPEPAPEPTPPAAEDEPLGEGGKKALAAERKARADAERRAKEVQAQLDELQAAQMTEQEKAVAEAWKQGEAEATAKVQRRLFAAESKVAASNTLTDPSLLSDPDVAQRLLGFDAIPVTEGGDIDTEAISAAIQTLTQERPYLAATATTPEPASATRPTGNPDNGSRGNDGPPQLTRDDLKTMSPHEIDAARKAGRLTELMGGKT